MLWLFVFLCKIILFSPSTLTWGMEREDLEAVWAWQLQWASGKELPLVPSVSL